MMKPPASMNRHTVGISAIFAALVVLGFTAKLADHRHVASLPEAGFATAENASSETRSNQNFFAQMKQIPPNAYGSARSSEGSLGQKITSGIKAVLPSMGSKSAQTESKNWSDDDWRIAEQAVADHRRASKNSDNASAASEPFRQHVESIESVVIMGWPALLAAIG